jgi:hypothetical protein
MTHDVLRAAWRPLLAALALALPAPAGAADRDRARFVVTDEIVNPDLQPFTATIGAMGNVLIVSGFEQKTFRTLLQAEAASPDRIVAAPRVVSHWDSWRTGALDGAEVEVLRIEDGAFRSVRRDRVARGGHQASGWLGASGGVLDPGATGYEFAFDGWNRPAADYHFTVRAVDRRGRLSPPAEAAVATAPEELPRERPEVDNPLVEIEIAGKGGRLPAPADLRAETTEAGTIRLDWSPVAGAAGYVVYRSDAPPEAHRGHHFALEGSGPGILPGDLVILRHRFANVDRADMLSNRVWNAGAAGRPFVNGLVGWQDAPGAVDRRLVAHAPDTPVEEPGETYLRATLAQGEVLELGGTTHAGRAQDWYPVLEPGRSYRFEVWMRGRSTQPVTFRITGFYGGGEARIEPIRFSVTPEWRRHTGTFEIPEILDEGHGPVGQTQLRLTGPGTFDVDNFRVWRDDAPFLAFLPEDVARLEASGMGMLRTHAFIKTGQSTYGLAQLTQPGGLSGISRGNSLPQTLEQTARVGMDSWLQIEPHFSREEWLGLVEYLAAPFDPATDDAGALPWAAKRAAQGHGPWTEAFDRILFEIGNETWNQLFAPWTFPEMTDAATGESYGRGEVYGLYQEYVLGILRESPHWPALAPVLEPVIGGWAINGYGLQAAARSPSTPFATDAAYNGGWDENAGPARPDAAGLFTVLTDVLQSSLPRAEARREAVARIGAARGAPLAAGTYEAGPGYVMDGLNNARISEETAERQERAMKSVAAGTATLDAFLMRAAHGQVIQNFFTYGDGRRWTSHARWQNGGQTYPSWDLLALFNREGLGDVLAVETVAAPRVDLPESRRRQAVADAPLAAAYATRSGDRLTLVVLSRRTPGHPTPGDGTMSVTVDLPIASAERLTVHSQTGDWQSNNVYGQESRLVSETMPLPDGLPRLEIEALPPGETLVYVFDGVR